MATVVIPAGMETPRYQAPRMVEVNGEIPLIDSKARDEKKVQERFVARCRVFNLLDENERLECEQVWQGVCDGKYVVSQDIAPQLIDGKLITFIRYSEKEYIAPPPV